MVLSISMTGTVIAKGEDYVSLSILTDQNKTNDPPLSIPNLLIHCILNIRKRHSVVSGTRLRILWVLLYPFISPLFQVFSLWSVHFSTSALKQHLHHPHISISYLYCLNSDVITSLSCLTVLPERKVYGSKHEYCDLDQRVTTTTKQKHLSGEKKSSRSNWKKN